MSIGASSGPRATRVLGDAWPSLTVVPLRIGLVTAADSAAYADFLNTLTASGFSFQIVHVAATMQGTATAPSVVSAVRRLQREPLDLIFIIRGGGSPGDLAWLDDERIARAVAGCPVPVWVGIGHEIDLGVLDHIARESHKTPTAVAEALVGRLREIDNRLAAAAERLRNAAARQEKVDRSTVGLVQGTRKQFTVFQERVSRHPQALQEIIDRRTARLADALSAARARLQAGSRNREDSGEQRLRWRQGRITAEAYSRRVALADERLAAKLAHVESLRPERLLTLGYSITRTTAGAIVRSISDVPPGTVVVTSLVDGTVTSNVMKIEERSDG